MNNHRVIGLTMGDPAGVGPELCLQALRNPDILNLCRPVVFGQIDVLQQASKTLSLPLPDHLQVQGRDSSPSGLHPITVIDCPLPDPPPADTPWFTPGQVSAAAGAAAYSSISAAIQAALAGTIDAVVTAPINKESLRLAGIPHAGHTEIFTALTGVKRSCMMLRSDPITVSMVTTHIGYSQVPSRLTVERILDVIELTAAALASLIGRPPHLAVCGLNPHAGEHGLFGREEQEVIEPAIYEARNRGFHVTGPLPPDTAFVPGKMLDATVCMYHDQGHIPFKMLAFDLGVNITLGLPIIRTSVDHGTAFDIAWKGLARPHSLFKSIDLAIKLAASTHQNNRH